MINITLVDNIFDFSIYEKPILTNDIISHDFNRFYS